MTDKDNSRDTLYMMADQLETLVLSYRIDPDNRHLITLAVKA